MEISPSFEKSTVRRKAWISLSSAFLILAAIASPGASAAGEPAIGEDLLEDVDWYRAWGLDVDSTDVSENELPMSSESVEGDRRKVVEQAVLSRKFDLLPQAMGFFSDDLIQSEISSLVAAIKLDEVEVDESVLHHLLEEGVSRDDAVEQLQLQEAAGWLNAALLSHEDRLAGTWLDHNSKKLHVALEAEGARSWIQQAIESSSVGDQVEFHLDRQLSIKDAMEMVERLTSLEEDREYSAWYDEVSGVISVAALPDFDTRMFEELLSSEEMKSVRFELSANYASAPTASLFGGLSPSGTTCEIGFAASGSYGTGYVDGIMTAGHCNNSLSYGGSSIPYVRQWNSLTDADSQFHRAGTAHTVDNKILWRAGSPASQYYSDITSRYTWAQHVTNAYVCQNGSSSYIRQCGNVLYKTGAPGFVTSPTATWVYATTDVCGGDSGASVYYGNKAYGIAAGGHSTNGTCSNGKTKYHQLIYAAIDKNENRVSANVKTS